MLPSELDDEGETSRNLACAYGDFRTSLPPPAQNVRTLWAELADALSQTQRPRPNLFDGLSPEESNLVVSRAAVHRFQEGEVVAMGAERRAGLGVILRGRMGVGIPSDDGHHWVELFGAGDVFGEPDAPPLGRAADLVALSPCDAAFLPADIVERLERKKPALAMKLARNLMAVLRQRVDDLHRRAA